MCVWLAALGFCASAHSRSPNGSVETPTAREVLSELSRRSKLPEEELVRLTADCAASQQSIYFCAYRDLVAADLSLRRVVSDKGRRFPACKPAMDAGIHRWELKCDKTCARRAAREWRGGSMEPAARNLCVADSTGAMVRQMQRMTACPGPAGTTAPLSAAAAPPS